MPDPEFFIELEDGTGVRMMEGEAGFVLLEESPSNATLLEPRMIINIPTDRLRVEQEPT